MDDFRGFAKSLMQVNTAGSSSSVTVGGRERLGLAFVNSMNAADSLWVKDASL